MAPKSGTTEKNGKKLGGAGGIKNIEIDSEEVI